MKPIDFVIFDGDSSPNTPIVDIHTAMNTTIQIHGSNNKFKILSYYYDPIGKCMVLDIAPKKKLSDPYDKV